MFVKRAKLSEVKKQEEELLEAQSIPLRNYLMKHVMPTLTLGLIECCQQRPEDPVDFLVSIFHEIVITIRSKFLLTSYDTVSLLLVIPAWLQTFLELTNESILCISIPVSNW